MTLFALYCGCMFRKINRHILPGFLLLVSDISLVIDKTDVKNVLPNSLFFQKWPAILSFFDLCHLPTKC